MLNLYEDYDLWLDRKYGSILVGNKHEYYASEVLKVMDIEEYERGYKEFINNYYSEEIRNDY